MPLDEVQTCIYAEPRGFPTTVFLRYTVADLERNPEADLPRDGLRSWTAFVKDMEIEPSKQQSLEVELSAGRSVEIGTFSLYLPKRRPPRL